jgi:hypothetical protein
MSSRSFGPLHVALVVITSCVTTPAPVPVEPAAPPRPPVLLPEEVHLSNLRQLTFSGENAEAYWRFDGKGLSLQAHARRRWSAVGAAGLEWGWRDDVCALAPRG